MSGTRVDRGALAALAAVALAMAGCGEDEVTPRLAAAKAQRGAPAQLVGTYAMTFDRRDLPEDPAPELTAGSKSWTLQISNSGGTNGGPAISLANDEPVRSKLALRRTRRPHPHPRPGVRSRPRPRRGRVPMEAQ